MTTFTLTQHPDDDERMALLDGDSVVATVELRPRTEHQVRFMVATILRCEPFDMDVRPLSDGESDYQMDWEVSL